jgi:hypothetical protein
VAFPMGLVLRTTGQPEAIATPLRAAIASVDQTLALDRIQSMETFLSASLAPHTFRTTLMLGIDAARGHTIRSDRGRRGSRTDRGDGRRRRRDSGVPCATTQSTRHSARVAFLSRARMHQPTACVTFRIAWMAVSAASHGAKTHCSRAHVSCHSNLNASIGSSLAACRAG